MILPRWFKGPGMKRLHIEPGSTSENTNCASFNGKLRSNLLNGNVFDSLR